MIIVFVFEIGGKNGNSQRHDIHEQVKRFSFFLEYLGKLNSTVPPQKDKGQHIENKMPPVGMYQSATEKTIPLVPLAYRRRIKDKILHDLLVIESTDGNNDGNNNYNESD